MQYSAKPYETGARISFPSGDAARRVEARRACRSVRELPKLCAMELRPEISSSSAFSSCVSGELRIVPSIFVMKPSVGESWILSCRARSRARLRASMSFVASRPAFLRATVASDTGAGLAMKVCQGAETAAKPERSAIREMPIMPTRSRQASLRPLPVWEAMVWM